MRYILPLIAGLAVQIPAQASNCLALDDVVHQATLLWPTTTSARLGELPCSISDDKTTTRCFSKEQSLENINSLFKTYESMISQCLHLEINRRSSVTSPTGIVHHRQEYKTATYKDQPFNFTLVRSTNTKTATLTAEIKILPAKINDVYKPLCNWINDLLSDEHLNTGWRSFRGPKEQDTEQGSTYLCAREYPFMKSRFDCEFEQSPTQMEIKVRWTYPNSLKNTIHDIGLQIAEGAQTCAMGSHVQKGKSQHSIDVPNKNTTIAVQSRTNDVGRGPSVEIKVRHTAAK
jgi:hypothetical protein